MSDVKVALMEPRLRTVAGVNLHPGLQAVSSDDWSAIAGHPIGAQLIERGVIVQRKVKRKPDLAPETEAKPAPRAAELVEEIRDTYDVTRLRELAEDSRKTVAEAAGEQLHKIEGMGK